MELTSTFSKNSDRSKSASCTRLLGDDNHGENDNTKKGLGNFNDAVEAAGFGKFHALLLIVCGWADMSDAVEVLSVSFLLPSASNDFGITNVQKGLLTSVIFVGILIGGYVWGCLADVWGRRRVLIFSLASDAVFGLISSFCQNFWLFLFMKFLSGIGLGGNMPLVFAYTGEFQPAKHRGKMISTVCAFWMCGNILAAALAWAIIPRDIGYHNDDGFSYESWRIFVAVCCIPSATSVITFLWMPESPKYLLEKGNEEEALEILKKIYCWNNKGAKASDYPIDHLIPSSREDSSLMRRNENQGTCFQLSEPTIQLFKPPLTRNTAVLLIVMFSLSFGYYGLFMWFPELFKRVEYGGSACSMFNKSINMTEPSDRIYVDAFYTTLATLPGNFLTIVLIDRLSRKSLLTSSMIISGISVFFIWFLKTRIHVLIMSGMFGAISIATWNTFYVVNVELYPTSCRSTSLGVVSMINRIGAILGTLLFGILIDVYCAVPMILVAMLLGIGGLTALILPDSTNIELT